MIIQQGRLSDNKATVNKDDLLSMVRYGAEMVFSGGGGTITDEDIDAIIAKVSYATVFLTLHCNMCQVPWGMVLRSLMRT